MMNTMKRGLLLLLSCLHHSAVPASARLTGPIVEPESEHHQGRRRLTGTDRYLKTSKRNGGDGLSPDTPYNDAEEAIAALKPGDTLYLMGQITNPSYNEDYEFDGDIDDPHIWHGEHTLAFSKVEGTLNDPITVTSYDDSTVVKGDGANIIRIQNCKHLIINGLHIKGEVGSISLDTAKALQFVYRDKGSSESKYRLRDELLQMNETMRDATLKAEEKLGLLPILNNISRPTYTDTRGIYASGCYKITISNCRVHHMPGGGIRASYSEYVDVLHNEVHDVSRKSFSGTHALVVTYTKDEDGPKSGHANYRARIVGNLIHNNYNEIYSWTGGKDFIHAGIDEGKGISLQRNQRFNHGGRILVANNLAAYNGYSGIHSNDGDNIDFFSNTAFLNSYTAAVTYDYKKGGGKSGISLAGGKDCKIGNNLVVVDTDVKGAPIVVTDDTKDTTVHSNLVFGVGTEELKPVSVGTRGTETNTIKEDPLLARPAEDMYAQRSKITAIDFSPMEGSPAIMAGKKRFAIGVDYYGHARDVDYPTLGGIENSHEWHLENPQ